jgi:hypothetical protein
VQLVPTQRLERECLILKPAITIRQVLMVTRFLKVEQPLVVLQTSG